MYQALLNSLFGAAAIIPLTIDILLVYRLYGCFAFTSAAFLALAPYVLNALQRTLGFSGSLLGSSAAIVLTAFLVGKFFANRANRHPGSSLELLLISLGLMTLSQNSLGLVFGSQPVALSLPGADLVVQSAFGVAGAARVGMVFWAIASLATVYLLERFTRIGLVWRALAEDPALARSMGTDPRRVLPWAFCLGALLTSGVGLLQAADSAMTPHMGLRPFMLAVAVAVIAGNRLWRVTLACLLVAMAQNLGGLLIGNRWQDCLVFVILVLFLLVRHRESSLLQAGP